MTLRKLTVDDVVVTVTHDVEESRHTIRDHGLRESEISERLKNGDTWAWCTATVTATYGTFRGEDCRYYCSHVDEADFRSGYDFPGMVDTAILELNHTISVAANLISGLQE